MKQGTFLTNFVVFLMFIVITLYISVTGLRTLFNPYQTVTACSTSMEDSISVSGWIVRDEASLPASGGFFHLRLNEGDRIAKNQPVATVYQSEDALSRQETRLTLMSQLSQLEYAISDESVSGNELEEKLVCAMSDLRTSSFSGDYTHLNEYANTFKELLLRREFLYSQEASEALGLATLSLNDQLADLKATANSDASPILAPASGIFSVQTDGYEAALTPDKLDELSITTYQALTTTHPSSTSTNIGKLVFSCNWYFVAPVPEENAKLFSPGLEVSVRLSSLTEPLPMRVESISKAEASQVLVVLSSDRNLKNVVALRTQAGHIVCHSNTGISVPRSALRVKEDGTVGVYTVTGYRAEFKPVRVLAETKTSYLLEANPSDSSDKLILRAGDEVLLASAELYDGKVVR